MIFGSLGNQYEEIDKEMRRMAIEALVRLKKLDELLLIAQDSGVEDELRRIILNFFTKLDEKDILFALATNAGLDNWVRIRASQFLYLLDQGDLALSYWLYVLLFARRKTIIENAAETLEELAGGGDAMRIILLDVIWDRVADLVQQQSAMLETYSDKKNYVVRKLMSFVPNKNMPSTTSHKGNKSFR